MITHPDGDLGAYLDSLDAMLAAVREHRVGAILPGHGPVVGDPVGLLTYYLGDAAASAFGRYGLYAAGGAVLLTALGVLIVRKIEKHVVEDD